MSSEVITDLDITSVDPEVLADIFEFKSNATEAVIQYYGNYLDKVLAKTTKKLVTNEENAKKLSEIKEKHLKSYQKYVEKCLDKQLKTLFEKKSIVNQLVYISDHQLSEDHIDVEKAVHPFKEQFVRQLKAIKELVDNRYEEKCKQLSDLSEELTTSLQSYESENKSLKKKVLTIIDKLDSIDFQDVE